MESSAKIEEIKNNLESLYGDSEKVKTALEGIKEVMDKYEKTPHKGQRFSEKDSILITYADTLKREGEKGFKTFKKFSNKIKGVLNTVHFLPFFPYSSDYGFSIKDHKEVRDELGSWKDIEDIGSDFKLMFDLVVNHVSSESRWFKEYLKGNPKYEDFFIEVGSDAGLSKVFRPRCNPLVTKFGDKEVWTTFSKDEVDLNYKNPNVLVKMVEYLLLLVKRGASFIRVDAIAYLWKEVGTNCFLMDETHQIMKIFRNVLDIVNPDVLLITEVNLPHEKNISYFGNGGEEAQIVYQFPLPPLVLYTFLRSDSTALTEWLRNIEDPPEGSTFLNFLASHDGIGLLPAKGILPEADIKFLTEETRRRGGYISYKERPDYSKEPYELNISYFDALSDPNSDEDEEIQIKRFIAAHSIILSLAGIPGIYIHSLLGSRNSREYAEETGEARSINRKRLDYDSVMKELTDPESLRHKVFKRISRLLMTRRKSKFFHPEAEQEVLDLGKRIFAVERKADGGKVLSLTNVTDEIVKPGIETSSTDLITGRDAKGEIVLGPYETVWIRQD